jgi:hypothetical protein
MDKDTNTSLEIIGRLLENDNIEMDDMSKIVDLLVDNKGVMTPNDLSKIVLDDEVFADVTGDTGWLDVEADYDYYEKLYPVFRFDTKDGRELTSPYGFLCYMLKSLGLTAPAKSDCEDIDDYVGDTGVSITYKDAGWTWVETGHTDPEWTVLYYSFGEGHGLSQYCDGVVDAY